MRTIRRGQQREKSFLELRDFFSRYLEWIFVFFFVGMILVCCIFSWVVAECSWNIEPFLQKNIPLPKNTIAIYIDGAVRKGGVFLIPKGSSLKNLLEKAGAKPEAVLWEKLYRKKRLSESGSLFIPAREDFSPTWDDTAWMEYWLRE